jgi:hypothetical protein
MYTSENLKGKFPKGFFNLGMSMNSTDADYWGAATLTVLFFDTRQ